MRKILEERLENARNDYYYLQKNSDGSDDYKLSEIIGQMEAYADVLNLVLPTPRTEQKILKDFEALGYVIVRNDNSILKMENNNYIRIQINKGECYMNYDKSSPHLSMPITIQEHKLLNELFEVWQWI